MREHKTGDRRDNETKKAGFSYLAGKKRKTRKLSTLNNEKKKKETEHDVQTVGHSKKTLLTEHQANGAGKRCVKGGETKKKVAKGLIFK